MERLEVQGTKTTPHIICELSGEISIKGRSIPENANAYYGPFLEWVSTFLKTNPRNIEINVFLDYINSISQKMIFDFFHRINEYHKSGCNVIVNWNYEEGDEEILDEGRTFNKKFDLDFKFLETEEED